MHGRSLKDLRHTVVPAAAACIVVVAIVVLATGASPAWLLLGVTATLAAAVLAPALREGRYFEPMTVIAAFVLIYFCGRALQLFIQHEDLYSFFGATSAVDSLLRMDNQEIARFVTEKLGEPLDPAMTRAMGACAVFMAAIIVGYYVPLGRRLGSRLGHIGARTAGLDVRLVVPVCLLLGLVGQVAILAKTGGLGAAANDLQNQRTGRAGYMLYILASFAPVGVVIWLAWKRPVSRAQWIVFALLVAEICAFSVLTGSRSRVLLLLFLLAVTWHYLLRRWRLRELVVAVVVFVAFSSAVLGVRQGTAHETLGEALRSAPSYLVDPRGILNDNTQFDQLFIATSSLGHGLEYQHGRWLLDGIRSNVPAAIDPGKPEAGDIVFRKAIWGNELGAGRPITIVGDFYYDFGFAGIAVGSLLLGLLARVLLGLLGSLRSAGVEYRVSLYAIGLLILYEALVGTYSLAFSFAIALLVPYLVAVHGIGRVPDLLRGRLATAKLVDDEPSGGA